MPARNGENSANKKTCIGFKKFFADKYHNLKLNQKLSAGNMGCHSKNTAVLTRDIASVLANLAMTATMDQRHTEKLT